jgi:hypothetical protein
MVPQTFGRQCLNKDSLLLIISCDGVEIEIQMCPRLCSHLFALSPAYTGDISVYSSSLLSTLIEFIVPQATSDTSTLLTTPPVCPEYSGDSMASSTIGNAALQTHVADVEDRGLRFTNDEWNGRIANGQPIMLRWNESIEVGEMRLFRISYLVDGVVALELMANWTGVWYNMSGKDRTQWF